MALMKLGILIGTPEVAGPLTQVILGGPDLEGNICKAAARGYDGVELALRDPAYLDSQKICSWLDKYGLHLSALSTGAVFGEDGLGLIGMPPGIAEAAEVRLKAIIDFAAKFDGGIPIGIGRARGRWVDSGPASWDAAVAAFRRLADYALPKGVRVGLEPANHHEINYIFTAREGLDWVEKVDRPNFGLVLDTYHLNIEEQNIYASLRQAYHHCWDVHIADNNRRWPGNAHIDFASIVATLEDVGYTGYLSVEAAPWPDPDTAGQETIHYMRRWVPKERQ
jgi:sugar phosphate isomerase/epimerase